MLGALAVVVTATEFTVCALAAYAALRRVGYRGGEAAAVAALMPLLLLSALAQLAFVVGCPALTVPCELGLLIVALFVVRREWSSLQQDARRVRELLGHARWSTATLLVCACYLAAQALLLPAGNWDSMAYNLTRVLWFEQEHGFFVDVASNARQVAWPVGSDILTHYLLRFGTDAGLGLFSLVAYAALGLAVYAVARNHADAAAARLTALVVVALPEFVLQSTSTKNDLLAATIAACLVALLHRLSTQARAEDLILAALLLLFGWSAKTSFAGIALLFTVAFGWVLLVQRSRLHWSTGKRLRAGLIAAAVPIGLLHSHLWLLWRNEVRFGGWAGPPQFTALHFNHDGWRGALANAVRYGLAQVQLTRPVDLVWEKLSGTKLSAGLQQAVDGLLPASWSTLGIRQPFEIAWWLHEDTAWFGPLALLIVLPALVFALVRGPTLLRLTALIALGHAGAVCWQLAWMPWNSRFFGIAYALAGCCVVVVARRWSGRWSGRLLEVAALTSLVAAMLFNDAKPLLSLSSSRTRGLVAALTEDSIWARCAGGLDRGCHARRHFGDDRVAQFVAAIPAGARVGIETTADAWLFPFMAARRDLRFAARQPVGASSAAAPAPDTAFDWLLCDETACPERRADPVWRVVWSASEAPGVRPGALLQRASE